MGRKRSISRDRNVVDGGALGSFDGDYTGRLVNRAGVRFDAAGCERAQAPNLQRHPTR
jgi:hypothetical protein